MESRGVGSPNWFGDNGDVRAQAVIWHPFSDIWFLDSVKRVFGSRRCGWRGFLVRKRAGPWLSDAATGL
jgi:hypothetical protein